MIKMVQKNVAIIILKKFPIIKKASSLNVFFGKIYTIILKFLAIISIII